MAPSHVALLRGINVGGHHKIPMADLRALLAARGLRDVATLIQSGNVVFSSDASSPALQDSLAQAISERFGFDVPVVVRTAEAFRAALAASPYADEGHDDRFVAIGFLPGAPASTDLDPDRSPGDRFAVLGHEVHVHFAHGQANTRLTSDWFDRQLGQVSTFRNLRTCRRIADLLAG